MTSKFNALQQPKDPGYLECWKARPGHKWLQLDFAAVEPTVLAQFSRCPSYRKLYGPDANPHQDVYLFVGSKFSHFRDEVLKYYDPENPTAESTARAKKELKQLRGVFKEAHLACIQKGELIRVRGKGLLSIEKVQAGMEVWDGEQWVFTDGAVYKGRRRVLSLRGRHMTADHKVLTYFGWRQARVIKETKLEHVRSKKPSATWTDVWSMVRGLFSRAQGQRTFICRSFMPTHQNLEIVQQP